MPARSHPSNPLALAVLALLFERPMHPYEMGLILKQRHKEESIKFRYGSLYTVIDLLLRRRFILARMPEREGRRPERTVYEITPTGCDELRTWMADLISEPIKEYPQFEAALCLLPVLPPGEALALLRRRLKLVEDSAAALARPDSGRRRSKLSSALSGRDRIPARAYQSGATFCGGLDPPH